MMLELSGCVAEVLRRTLTEVISDLSSEIADTDNPRFRTRLQERRACVQTVREQLDTAPSSG